MKRFIRVAMIIQAYHPHVGGAERQLAALAPLLREQQVEVHILTRRYEDWAAFEIIDNVPVHRLPVPGPKAVASLSFTLAALSVLARLKPDVIHAHELLSPTTTALLAKRLLGQPVVAKVLRGGNLGDLAKLKSRQLGLRRIVAIRKHTDAFITISQEIKTELTQIGIPAGRQAFIPNGVDTARFVPLPISQKRILRSKLGLPQGPLVIFSGRLSPEKRVCQLVDLWPAIRAVHPQAALLILGTGEEDNILRKRAGSGVQLAGRIADVSPFLKTADLFVLPSTTEGLSNSLLEALATGLPAIATAVGGAPDVIDHDDNGWLIPPDRPEVLSKAIIGLLGDEKRRLRFGRLGRVRVEREYALTTAARRLRNLYDAVLADQPVAKSNWPRRETS